jgi:Holliday junction resolvase RusA-like endonuclease
LKLVARFYVESLWIGDTDNRVKALQDTIFKVFLNLNDVLVTRLSVEKIESKNPYCEVSISFVESEEK